MDHHANNLAALTAQLDLKHAPRIGHPTGGDDVKHYRGQHGGSRVAIAALISAVPLAVSEDGFGGDQKTFAAFRRWHVHR